PLAVSHGHADAPLGDPEQEVDGAVQRVHHPGEAAASAALLPGLLSDETVLWATGADQLADRSLRRHVRLADQVGGRALAHHLALAAAPGPLGQELSRHAGGLACKSKQLAAAGVAHENCG